MASEAMIKKLNSQLNKEFFSSNLYLQMCAWCSHNGLEGAAAFLKTHAAEEKMHMDKFFTFIDELGGLPIIGKLEAPGTEYKNISDMMDQILAHEKFITKSIHELADAAWEERDHAVYNFLQWFISEQHEEETLFRSLIDKLKLVGADNKQGLFLIDRELGQMAAAEAAAPAE
ncbi:MAG: non-heme ferritin [Calditrichales bacterium]|nr:MAG: non-heme ferritin [Calditrichales bacterium]